MTRPLLEIAANSLGSALAAQAGGADRIELCANLSEAGTTPSPGTLAVTRDRLRIPICVLIRPRTGDFCYDDADVEVMLRDIETCVSLGCDGIVIGALDADGAVDVSVCRALIAAAGILGVTFHRAFDVARDQDRALRTIIDLGCERVLTSGGETLALAGAGRIAELVEQAGSEIAIMAGAGIDASNVREIVERSHVSELHASARGIHISPSRHRNDKLPELKADWWETDASAVRAIADVLHRWD
ncbi:MAG TPA: copper homeostasis protein CutC [Gemmatimonadaceae bacterium]